MLLYLMCNWRRAYYVVLINYHLLTFLLFMLGHMFVFSMQYYAQSCHSKFHVRDNKVLTYILTYYMTAWSSYC